MRTVVFGTIRTGDLFFKFGSPAGLNVTNDEALYTLLNDLETWKKNLPDNLQFRGPESPRNAGMSSSPHTSLITYSNHPTSILAAASAFHCLFGPVVCCRIVEFTHRGTRNFVYFLCRCEHALLACIHAYIIFLPCAPQVLSNSRKMD